MVLQLEQAPVYRIYLFSRGWFYLKLMEGSLDYIEVKHGQHMSVHLALQVPKSDREVPKVPIPLNFQQLQKIPIDSFFRSTVPEETHDCEADATFNYDEVPSVLFEDCAIILIQEVIRGFFECVNTTFGCIVPCYGGVYMPQNYSICTNASYFDYGIIGSCFENGMALLKTSCKITDINYGPLHVTSDQNTTR